MVRDSRFRGFTLAHVESVEAHEDGTVSVIGLSGSGDAVAMIVRPETIDDLVSRLQTIRRTQQRRPDPQSIPPAEHEPGMRGSPSSTFGANLGR